LWILKYLPTDLLFSKELLDFVKGITGKAPPWNSEVNSFD
jgi:hypothetical protein